MESKINILITGATGFVGAYLLRDLLADASVGKIYVLCRNIQPDNERQRLIDAYHKFSIDSLDVLAYTKKIRMIEGDITQPSLGINRVHYQELCKEVDVIYHVAARVNHIRPYEALKGANVDSLADIISMARTEKSKIVNFVSTLGSAAKKDTQGFYVEELPDDSAPWHSDMGYLQSKWEAEKLLSCFQNKGGKTNLFRLGYISGHSQTGAALFANNQFMLLVKSCIQLGYAPVLARTINFTPIDYTVALMSQSKYRYQGGEVLNLFNYNGLIDWSDIVNWLNARGYNIKIIPFYEWQSKLLADNNENALHRFLPLYGSEGAHDKILRFGLEIEKFHYKKVKEATESAKYVLPLLKYELLDRYLGYLQSQKFLPVPQGKNELF
ncbi:thioester reductase domain-containing protein [Serratia fonticola]|uniref:Thioester reductase domain-containing protein n=1 Tax=Serratia fonticola TaxID=47917 RepID=A0AAJ1Y738_SERFO|nr:thioester reductase domain-containing protein [Serratia fonticola]MDQ9124923.1 thioester reductase domain-containing protein [Serratia fonticola]OKP26140.1 polyketide synthase [Serratia fonticola]